MGSFAIKPTDGPATDRKDNATATASAAAVVGSIHRVTRIDAGFGDSTVAGTLTVNDGVTPIFVQDFIGDISMDFDARHPLSGTISTKLDAVLSASGAPGTYGSVTMHYWADAL